MTDTNSEEWRHQTECREVASWPEPKRERHFANVEQKRGAQAAQELRRGVAELLRWQG